MAKSAKKSIEKVTEKLGIEERKRRQYQEVLEKRETARADLEHTERHLKEHKERVSERQNRINVLEYLFTTLTASNPTIEEYLMSMIELENDEIRDYDETIKKFRTNLTNYRQHIAKAERIIASIIENGPNMQDNFAFNDDDSSDGKSRPAGK